MERTPRGGAKKRWAIVSVALAIGTGREEQFPKPAKREKEERGDETSIDPKKPPPYGVRIPEA